VTTALEAARAMACAWLRRQMAASDALHRALGVTRYRPLLKVLESPPRDRRHPTPSGEG
jgi:hypothetical protein